MAHAYLTFSELVDEWRIAMLAEDKQPKTIHLYVATSARFIDVMGDKPIGEVTRGDIRRYLIQRGQDRNPRTGEQIGSHTVHQDYRNLKRAFSWAKSEGYLDRSPVEGVKAPTLPKDLPKALRPEEIRKLFKAAGRGQSGKRNELIVRFFLDTGVRVSELAKLDVGDVDLEIGTARIRQGKGRKDRIVPLGAKLRLQIHRYVRDNRRPAPGEQALLVNRNGDRLESSGIQEQIKRLKKASGIHVSPHMLRHTFATEALRNGADLETIRRIMGHSTLSVTQVYLHLLDTDLTKAHRSFSPGDRY